MQTLRHARVWVALGCTLGWAPVGAQDLPAEVAQALARAGVPESSVAMVVAPLPPPPGTVSRAPEPVNPGGEANPSPAPQPLPALPGRKLTPGQPWEGLGVLAERLVALGDLPPQPTGEPPAASAPAQYTPALVEAVTAFQRRAAR